MLRQNNRTRVHQIPVWTEMRPHARRLYIMLIVWMLCICAIISFARAQDKVRPPLLSATEQEVMEPNEKENIKAILDSSVNRLKSQFPDGKRPVLRDAHPKAHGFVSAEFIVLDGLPEELRHGIFKTPHTYKALIRFSAGNVEVQADTVPQAAGMAIKLFDVDGEKLLDAEKDARTQDFIMINAPLFFVRNLQDYVLLHEALDKGQLEAFFKSKPAETNAILTIRGQKLFNPAQVRYWSMTPYLIGERAMKFSAIPISHTANTPPTKPGPDFLREALKSQISSGDTYYDFSIQLQGDPARMPIEDPVVEWNEADSPFQRVAIIRIPKQDITSGDRDKIGEALSFTPWHGLREHRPLGSNNRARRVIYEGVSEFRHRLNGVTRQEPTDIPW
ncbi:catalase family protein [Brucella intermedia]|uniref:catalase family protein n=1 Tax=Brucella intermedia TaxID=94625 RepID=UPI00124E2B46|nr:catalase family protein [Brucella intermedia]KAB2723340.1 catalase family protein [Brucella intermedia]